MKDLINDLIYDYPFLFVFAILFFVSLSFMISDYLFIIPAFIVLILGFFSKRVLIILLAFLMLFFVFNYPKSKNSENECKNSDKGVIEDITTGRNLSLTVKTNSCKLYLFAPVRYKNVKIGDIVWFRGRLRNIGSLKNKQFANYLRSRSIKKYGFVYQIHVLGKKQPLSFLESTRERIEREFYYFLPSNVEYFLDSAVLGDNRFKSKIKKNFVDTQTAHIMVVSGLHIGFVFGLFYLIFYYIFSMVGYIYRRYNLKVLSSFTAFVPTLIYFLITGFHIPAIRSFLMTVLFVLSLIFSKKKSSFNILFLIASIFVTIDYLSLLNPSFVMSFLMTLFALLLYSFVSKIHFSGLLKTSVFMVAMSCLAIPISSFYFSKISYISFIANLIVIPTFGFLVVPIAFLGIAVSSLPYSLAKVYIFKFVALVVNAFLEIVNFLANLAHPLNYRMPLLLVVTLYIAFFLVFFMVNRLLHRQGSLSQTPQKISF